MSVPLDSVGFDSFITRFNRKVNRYVEQLFQSIDQISERLRRKGYRHKPVAGLNQDAWSFGMCTVDNVVIFDRAGMQPETAEGIHWGVSGNDSGLWRSIKAFSQVFYIPLRVSGWVIRQL